MGDLWFIAAASALSIVLFEILLVLRKGLSGYRGYLALLVGDLALLGWVVEEHRTTRQSGAPTVELIAGLAAFVLLVVVPSLLDRLARRLATGPERLDVAARLIAIKELLVPGTATAAEHTFYSQLARARAGESNSVIAELRRQLVETEPPDDVPIQERIVTVLVFAKRYREAVAQFETHLAPGLLSTEDGDEVPRGEIKLRSPALAIQIVRALGELGELQRAAQLVSRLQQAARRPTDPAPDPGMHAVILQTRLQLLAFAGRDKELARIFALKPLRKMPPAMREFLLETARKNAGRVPPGPPAPPPVEFVEGVLSHAHLTPSATDELGRFLDHIAERTVAEVNAIAAVSSRAFAPATFSLVTLNLIAFALFWLLVGDTDSGDHLLRGGATYDPAVRAGEWWRLWTAMFLHGGLLHLGLNMYFLLVVGRVVEPILGTARFVVVYALAGLAGNLASVYHPGGRASFSLGASGAIMGILGALVVILWRRRGNWGEQRRQDVLLNLSVLIAVQLWLGLKMPIIDNFAHLGGLVGGAFVALVLLPGGALGRGRIARLAVGTILAALSISAGSSLVSVARERPSATLDRLQRQDVRSGRIAFSLLPGYDRNKVEPPDWPDEEMFLEPAVGLHVFAHLLPMTPGSTEHVGSSEGVAPPSANKPGAGGVGEVLRGLMAHDVEEIARLAKDHGSTTVEAAVAPAAGPGTPNPEWAGLAQAIPQNKEPLVLLYYARPADAATAVVIEMSYQGDRQHGGTVDQEIARILASVTVAPPAAGP